MSDTETLAKTKWCPLVQLHGTPSDDSISNRNGMFDNAPMCIGSACMAWRWSRAKETAAYLEAVQAHMKEHSVNFNVATQKVYADLGSTFDRSEGYCGQFGRPE